MVLFARTPAHRRAASSVIWKLTQPASRARFVTLPIYKMADLAMLPRPPRRLATLHTVTLAIFKRHRQEPSAHHVPLVTITMLTTASRNRALQTAYRVRTPRRLARATRVIRATSMKGTRALKRPARSTARHARIHLRLACVKRASRATC